MHTIYLFKYHIMTKWWEDNSNVQTQEPSLIKHRKNIIKILKIREMTFIIIKEE